MREVQAVLDECENPAHAEMNLTEMEHLALHDAESEYFTHGDDGETVGVPRPPGQSDPYETYERLRDIVVTDEQRKQFADPLFPTSDELEAILDEINAIESPNDSPNA